MYVKIDGQRKSNKRNELTSDSRNFLINTETQTGIEEVYKFCPDSPNHSHLRNFLSLDIYIFEKYRLWNKTSYYLEDTESSQY